MVLQYVSYLMVLQYVCFNGSNSTYVIYGSNRYWAGMRQTSRRNARLDDEYMRGRKLPSLERPITIHAKVLVSAHSD
jgi:hypothetical protein